MATILVIDDSKLMAHVAESILKTRGHDVLLASDGESGLDITSARNPDLILLDLIMPGMDGYQVCEQIKKNKATADIPVIIVTSKTDPADKVRGLEIGASDYIGKPFDKGELIARVNTHLRIKELYENLQEKNRQLQELANRDGLTGLYNHRFFQDAVHRDFQKAVRYHENISCIIFDIDYFKKFNDTYGHQAGDMVLNTLGKVIYEIMRDTDLSARYGGEEFALLLCHTDNKAVDTFAERLRIAVEEKEFKKDDLVLRVTISIGVATYPHHEISDANKLIECADKALYRAKESGRNRVVSYQEAL
ncbi:MAG: diguanylate cyclase [Thermodesulfobacteriota bacterium]|nr:diguanylate cyclase [Thermodesulfobacteriota bacterium]